jgi:hypothetical protein
VDWRRSFGVVAGYDIHFFTLRIVSLPTEYAPLLGFCFFLLVNFVGGLLGYWIGTKYRIQLFASKWWKVLWGFVGIISIGLGFVFGALGFIEEDFGIALFSFGIAVFETVFLSYLLNNWTSIKSVKQ